MSKRIYSESVKKWAKTTGVAGSFIFLLFAYLISQHLIVVTDFRYSPKCAGNLDDPCWVEYDFYTTDDVFIYPFGYDPWGRNTPFSFTDGIESWKLQRKWGEGWRNIPLDKPCSGTWCGAPDNSGKNVYSVVFRKGKNYTIRIIGYKEDITKNITVSFNPTIVWGGVKIDYELLKFKTDLTNAEMIFKFKIDRNYRVPSLDKFKLKFMGKTNVEKEKYRIFLYENETYTKRVIDHYNLNPVWQQIGWDNETNSSMWGYANVSVPVYKNVIAWRDVWKEFNPVGKTIKADKWYTIKLIAQKKATLGFSSVDLVPTFGGFDFPWAWWNTSYLYRQPINFSVSSGVTNSDYSVENFIINSSNNGSHWNWTNECVNGNDSRVRFVSGDDGTTLWPYWVQSCMINQYINFTIKIDQNITTDDNDAFGYIYYGNDGGATASDPEAAYLFWDDFDYSGLNTSKWEHNYSIRDYDYTFTKGNTTVEGTLYLSDDSSAGNDGEVVCSKKQFNPPLIVEMDARTRYQSSYTFNMYLFSFFYDNEHPPYFNDGASGHCRHASQGNEWQVYGTSWTDNWYPESITTNQWYRWYIIANATTLWMRSNTLGNEPYDTDRQPINYSDAAVICPMAHYPAGGWSISKNEYDNIKVRRYHSDSNGTEITPTWTIGDEESSLDTKPPDVIFYVQSPADINSLNIMNNRLNITYNMSDSGSGLNMSNITLLYKVNGTVMSNWININGTGQSANFLSTEEVSNDLGEFLFQLDDNDVYPATYNIMNDLVENAAHSNYDLDGNKKYIKTKLKNISTNAQYGYLEFMADNQTDSSMSLRIYYCNDSYSTGSPSTSVSCTNFYNMENTEVYNRTLGNSSYYIIPFAILNGIIGNVEVTSTSYFLFRGRTGTNAWDISYTNMIADADTTQTTENDGIGWTNQSYTVDMHLHQFNGTDRLWYYACASDNAGNTNCTDNIPLETDLLETGNLPPIAPHVYSPTAGEKTGNININYTASISPNAYQIVLYNISLLNADETFNMTIVANNSPNLEYVWDSSMVPDGEYIIRVMTEDSNGLTSFGLSENFTTYNPTLDNCSRKNIGNLTVSSDTELYGDFCYSNVIINNSANLTVGAFNGTNNTGYLNLTALEMVIVESGSSINGNGKGGSGGNGCSGTRCDSSTNGTGAGYGVRGKYMGTNSDPMGGGGGGFGGIGGLGGNNVPMG